MLEIGISSIASIASVFIIYLHSNWMNSTPVPRWLLQLTFLTKKKRKILKFDENGCNGNDSTQVRIRNLFFETVVSISHGDMACKGVMHTCKQRGLDAYSTPLAGPLQYQHVPSYMYPSPSPDRTSTG
jgi:hypothetical protein